IAAKAAAAIFGFLACVPGAGRDALAQEQPVAPEANPPGDISDSQVFVPYASPLGFKLQVPEGWARSDRTDGVRFSDKYDSVEVSVAAAAAAPTAESAGKKEVPALEQS